jgi:hypothetical protein
MARFYDPNTAYPSDSQDVASYFRPSPRFATAPNPGAGMESAPVEDFGGYAPPPEHLPSLVGGTPPPELHRDSNANRTAGILAALLPILGGRADLAGQFGSAAIQGRRSGEDERYQRDMQRWQNQERQDAEGRAEDWRQFGADREAAQGRNQIKRWEAADTRQAEDSRLAEEDRQRQIAAQAAAAQERARLAQRGDVEFGVSQHGLLMKELKGLAPEARGSYLDALAQSGQLKTRGLDTTFQKDAAGKWNLPQFDVPPDTKLLGHELQPWHDVLANPRSTPAALAFALSQQHAILQKYGSRGAEGSRHHHKRRRP